MVQYSTNGWPVLRSTSHGFTAPNGHFVTCANADVAEVFDYLVDEWNRRIEQVTACFGFRASNSVNPYLKSISNHLSGTAIDVNGAKHLYEQAHPSFYKSNPYGALGFSQRGLDILRSIAHSIKGPDGHSVIRLGIDFDKGWRDAMHVEIAGAMGTHRATAADVRYAADVIRRRRGKKPVSRSTSRPSPAGAKAIAARKRIQAIVGVKQDAVIGPKTIAAIKATQARLGVFPDGHWGVLTEAAYQRFVDGKLGRRTYSLWQRNAKVKVTGTRTRALTKAVQKKHGAHQDGVLGPNTWKEIQKDLGVHPDGIAGVVTKKALQRALLRGRY